MAPARPDGSRHGLEIVALVCRVCRTERLLVRTGTGRRSAPGTPADDDALLLCDVRQQFFPIDMLARRESRLGRLMVTLVEKTRQA